MAGCAALRFHPPAGEVEHGDRRPVAFGHPRGEQVGRTLEQRGFGGGRRLGHGERGEQQAFFESAVARRQGGRGQGADRDAGAGGGAAFPDDEPGVGAQADADGSRGRGEEADQPGLVVLGEAGVFRCREPRGGRSGEAPPGRDGDRAPFQSELLRVGGLRERGEREVERGGEVPHFVADRQVGAAPFGDFQRRGLRSAGGEGDEDAAFPDGDRQVGAELRVHARVGHEPQGEGFRALLELVVGERGEFQGHRSGGSRSGGDLHDRVRQGEVGGLRGAGQRGDPQPPGGGEAARLVADREGCGVPLVHLRGSDAEGDHRGDRRRGGGPARRPRGGRAAALSAAGEGSRRGGGRGEEREAAQAGTVHRMKSLPRRSGGSSSEMPEVSSPARTVTGLRRAPLSAASRAPASRRLWWASTRVIGPARIR